MALHTRSARVAEPVPVGSPAPTAGRLSLVLGGGRRRLRLGGGLRDGSRGGQQTGRVSQCLVAFAQPACTAQPARRRSVRPSGAQAAGTLHPIYSSGFSRGSARWDTQAFVYGPRALPGGPRGTPARSHLYTSV